MLDAKQKVAVALSAALPVSSVGLFLGIERPVEADAVCPGGCWNQLFDSCSLPGSWWLNYSNKFVCMMYGSTYQWVPS